MVLGSVGDRRSQLTATSDVLRTSTADRKYKWGPRKGATKVTLQRLGSTHGSRESETTYRSDDVVGLQFRTKIREFRRVRHLGQRLAEEIGHRTVIEVRRRTVQRDDSAGGVGETLHELEESD
jgi:hypothetical protein